MSSILFFAFIIALEAVQQGIIVWTLREFSAEEYLGVKLAKYTGFALHFVGVASYLAVVAWVGYDAHLLLSLKFWAVALILRVVLFDFLLNCTKNFMNRLFDRNWEPLFSVGTSSLTDQVIQFIAKHLRWNASLTSGVLRAVALAALFWLT